jgi:hypothetical protein
MAPHKITLSTVFAGQKVGVKQVGDKIWEIGYPCVRNAQAWIGSPIWGSNQGPAVAVVPYPTRQSSLTGSAFRVRGFSP